jgi:hypothetical protein
MHGESGKAVQVAHGKGLRRELIQSHDLFTNPCRPNTKSSTSMLVPMIEDGSYNGAIGHSVKLVCRPIHRQLFAVSD